MSHIKNVKLEPAKNGFIVTYEYYDRNGRGDFSSMEYVNTVREVFEGDTSKSDAINKVVELKESEMNLDFNNK